MKNNKKFNPDHYLIDSESPVAFHTLKLSETTNYDKTNIWINQYRVGGERRQQENYTVINNIYQISNFEFQPKNWG